MPNLMDKNHAPQPSTTAPDAPPPHELTLSIEEYMSASIKVATLEFQRMPPADIEREKEARGKRADEAKAALNTVVLNFARAARRAGV